MNSLLGISAATGSSLAWALSTVQWRRMGDEMSPYNMNVAKGIFGAMFLGVACLCSGARPIGAADAVSLGMSGILGIAVGDTFYFRALIKLGARRASTLAALSPAVVALLASMLGLQRPRLGGWVGLAMSAAGVAWALRAGAPEGRDRFGAAGIVDGILAVFSMAVATLLAKRGAASTPATEAALIRVFFGVGALLLWGAAKESASASFAEIFNRRRLPRLIAIIALVTFGGFWLSLVALQNLDAWLATVLLSMTPLLVPPLAAMLIQERFPASVVPGTLLAVGGVIVVIVYG